MRWSWWFLGCILLVAGGILYVTQGAGSRRRHNISTVLVERGTVQVYVRAQGKIEAIANTTVRAKTEGLIIKVLVKEGEWVKPGMELIRFDRVKAQEGLRHEQEQFKAAAAELEYAEQDHRRVKKLVAKKLEASDHLDSAKLRLERARAAKRQASGAVTVAKDALGKLRVVAPQAGTVVAKLVEDGQGVVPGQDLLIVADMARLKVLCEVDEIDAARIVLDNVAEVTSESYQGARFTGRVTKIAPRVELDAKGEYPAIEIEIELEDRGTPLRIGNRVDAKIVVAERQNVLVIPSEAIVHKDDETFVRVLDEASGDLIERPVRIGLSGVHRVEVLGGLDEGEEIALSGPAGR